MGAGCRGHYGLKLEFEKVKAKLFKQTSSDSVSDSEAVPITTDFTGDFFNLIALSGG